MRKATTPGVKKLGNKGQRIILQLPIESNPVSTGYVCLEHGGSVYYEEGMQLVGLTY
jgi:hypothetical protein